jgi:hypothetical protein
MRMLVNGEFSVCHEFLLPSCTVPVLQTVHKQQIWLSPCVQPVYLVGITVTQLNVRSDPRMCQTELA